MRFHCVNEMVRTRVVASAQRTALMVKRRGQWRDITWEQFGAIVRDVSKGLIALGLNPGDRICVLGSTRAEWVYADLGIMGMGGITVPIYHSNTASESRYILQNCGAKLIFVENTALLDRLQTVRDSLDEDLRFVLFQGNPPEDDERVLTLSALMDAGRGVPDEVLDEKAGHCSWDDVATIVYTSGVTGDPKGAVLTHGNLLSQVANLHDLLGLQEDDITLLFLPLAHIFGRVIALISCYAGITCAFVNNLENLMDDLNTVKPHFFGAVPRIYEKLYDRIRNQIKQENRLRRGVFHWAIDTGREVSKARQEKVPLPLTLNARYRVAKRLVYDRLAEVFGGRLRCFFSSGAPLNRDIAEFFHAADILILEAYGMTELSGAVTINRADNYRFGTVGLPFPDTDIKLASDGEILVRGPTVMREYYNDVEESASTLVDGWLHTGDIGEIDVDGFLRITDRKKDLIITAGGKNIAPQKVERILAEDPLFDQVLVHGDRRNFLSALVTLNVESITRWAREQGLHYNSLDELFQKPDIVRMVQERINRKNHELASFETIKKFHILPHNFSLESGDLTPTLKLKRTYIFRKYADILDRFYKSEER